MKALKVVALISLITFLIACAETGTGNSNGNRSAGATNSNRPAATADNTNASSGANVNQSANATASAIDAAALFREQKCANCHGEDGKGKREGTPDFTSAEWQGRESDEELTEQIKKGDPPKMPAFESKLTEDQIKALVAHVRSFAK